MSPSTSSRSVGARARRRRPRAGGRRGARRAGANVNAVNDKGHTPLHWAAIAGNTVAAMHLILAGEVLCRRRRRRRGGRGDGGGTSSDRCRAHAGANPLQVDKLGHNGLLHAAQYGQSLACYFFLHLDRFVEGMSVPARAAANGGGGGGGGRVAALHA